MNKKKWIMGVALILVCIFVLAACTAKEGTHFEKLKQNIEKLQENYAEVLKNIAQETNYRYTIEFESETLSNYDDVNRLMPGEREPSQSKMWYKPKLSYTYIQDGADWYVELEYTEHKTNADGVPQYTDKGGKKPEYLNVVRAEYRYVGSVLSVKVDDSVVYTGTLAGFDPSDYTHDILYLGSGNQLEQFLGAIDEDVVYSAVTRSWFGQKILSYRTYQVRATGLASQYESYKDSALTSGYGEDLSFDWEKVQDVFNQTFSYTAKKDRLVKLEYYTEVIGSYQRSNSWYGDRISASKTIIEITYPTAKKPVTIPA